MAEQLRLGERAADRRGVDGDERTAAALRVLPVQRAREELLPGARLPGDQRRQVAERADLQQAPEEREHHRAVAHDVEPTHDERELPRVAVGLERRAQRHDQRVAHPRRRVAGRVVDDRDAPDQEQSAAHAERPIQCAVAMRDDGEAVALQRRDAVEHSAATAIRAYRDQRDPGAAGGDDALETRSLGERDDAGAAPLHEADDGGPHGIALPHQHRRQAGTATAVDCGVERLGEVRHAPLRWCR